MSKICEKCGNMIPDGSDVCPNCGREDDASIEAVLSELKDVFADLEPEAQDSPEVAPSGDEKTEEKSDDTILFDSSAVSKVLQESAQKDKKPKEPKAADAPKKKKPQQSGKNQSGKKKPASGKKSAGGKQEKDGSKALLGVVIGLIVLLVVVATAAVVMLYKMGFFSSMSDDELLATPSQAVTTLTPTEVPEISQAPVQPEASVSEESLMEESSAAEESTPVASEAPQVDCTKFQITGADDMTFFTRGETAEIVYVIDPSDAKDAIQWESSDETVATVSDFGVITARRGGSCTVTGTCGDKSVKVKVNCSFTVPETVLDMNYDDVTMDHEGQTLNLAIDYELTDEQVKATVWESSDDAVATVDDKGTVTAVADGTAVISASIGDYTASCIVRCVNVTGNKGVNREDSPYVINYEDVTLSRKGEYFQLTLKSVTSEELPAFTWKSSDTGVATVDDKGVVTAVANGTCKITTTVGQDNFECIVRVNIKN